MSINQTCCFSGGAPPDRQQLAKVIKPTSQQMAIALNDLPRLIFLLFDCMKGPTFPKTASDPDRRPRRHGPDGRGPSNGKPLLEIRCARAGPYSKLSHSEPLSNQTQSNQSIPIKPDLAAGGQSRSRTCASCAARGLEFVGRVRLRRTLIGWKVTARQRQNNTRDGPHFAVCLALPYKGFRLR